MRSLIGIAVISLFLTSCANSYHYQSESTPQKWEGQNISAVQKRWGSADQIMHTRSGNSFYLYTTTSGGSFFASTSTNFNLASNPAFPNRGQNGMKCSTLFETDAKGTIISATHAGDNCGGEWAPGKK
jgi:hypothetical protein